MKNDTTITSKTLDNGLVLITHNISWVQSVAIYVTVKAGPRYESNKSSGLAHFLEHMLFEGTEKHPNSKSLASSLESVGGKSSAWTDKESVSYSVKVPKENLENGVSYLSEILFNSALNDDFIEKEKDIIMEEMNRKKDNPESEIWDVFMEQAWGPEQSLGRSTLGDEATLKAIIKKKLAEYLEKFYYPGNMVISVVGNFSESNLLDYIQKYFSQSSQKKSLEMEKVTVKKDSGGIKKIPASTQQAQVVLGTVTGIHYFHPDRYIMRVIADILGTGVSSRIFNKLVYEMGIAYGAGVFNWTFKDTGMFCLYGGFSSENAEKAIEVMFDELRKLREELVSESELQLAKIQDISQTYYSLESPEALAYLYSSQYATEGRIITLDEIKKEINGVSAQDIQRVAETYLKEDNFVGIIRG